MKLSLLSQRSLLRLLWKPRPSPVEITTEDSRDSAPEPEGGGFFARMRKGLSKTRSVLVEGVTELFIGKKELMMICWKNWETQLLVQMSVLRQPVRSSKS